MIEISFKGDTPLEALSKAAAFGLHAAEDKRVADAARQILAAEKQARVQAPVNEPPAQEPATVSPPPPEAPTPAVPGPAAKESGPTAAPTETPPVPTAEEVRAKGIEASRKYGTAAIKPILQEFNVSRITEIAEADRAAFITRLEGLGEANV